MARLVLSLDGQVMAEYNMNKERYTIGRLPDNDIRIDNAAVSGHHSLIINILNDSFLEDLNSTNGTYANGKLIKKHALQHGDVITVGHHQLRLLRNRQQRLQVRLHRKLHLHLQVHLELEAKRSRRSASNREAATATSGRANPDKSGTTSP